MNLNKYWNQLKESEWALGILVNGFDDMRAGNIKWISNGEYTNKWFADPFILDYDDETITLLVEEFDYSVRRGRIARLLIDRKKWIITDCKIILDLDTHLSFPMIWREDGHVYVYPENYHGGAWNMYEYDTNEEDLKFVQEVYREKLTDAMICKAGGKYYILSTYEPTPNGSNLTVYKSDNLKGVYQKTQEIKFAENIARNAGSIFEHNGQLMRVAQECNYVYGHAIVFQKLMISEGKFSFVESYRYTSTNKVYKVGTHTYNQYRGMGVMDVKGYRYPKMANIINCIFNLTVKLGIKKRVNLS